MSQVEKLLKISGQTVPLPALLDKPTQGFVYLLEQGRIAEAVDYRIEQLRQKIQEDRMTSEYPKTTGAVSIFLSVAGFLMSQNPIFWVIAALSGTTYGASIILQYMKGKEIKPIPFFSGTFFDLQVAQNNAASGRNYVDPLANVPKELRQSANYLDPMERMEYIILRSNQKLAEQIFAAPKSAETRFAIWRIACRKLSDGTFTEYFNDAFTYQGDAAVIKPAKLKAGLQRLEAQLGDAKKHSILPAISHDPEMANLFLRPADEVAQFSPGPVGLIVGDDNGQLGNDVDQYLAPELREQPQPLVAQPQRPTPQNAIAPDAVDPAEFGIEAVVTDEPAQVPNHFEPQVPVVPPNRPVPNNRPGNDTKLGAIDVPHSDVTEPQAQDTNKRPQPAARARMPRVEGAEQLGGRHAENMLCVERKDPASQMARFDQDGNIRNWFLCGRPGAGKGTMLAAMMMAMTALFPMVEFWIIDPKDDPNELHRWVNVPAERRLHFEAGHPAAQNNPDQVERDIQDFIERFYESNTRPKILIVDELPAIVTVVSKKYAEKLRNFISNTASMGRSRQYAVWVSTQAVGVGENGLTITSKSSFSEAYLINKESHEVITSHPSFNWAKDVPSRLLRDHGRALFTTISMTWVQVPRIYKDMVDGDRQMVPITAEGEATTLPTGQQIELNAAIQGLKHKELVESEETDTRLTDWATLAKDAFDGYEFEEAAGIVVDVIVELGGTTNRKELLGKNKIKEGITKRSTTVSKIICFMRDEGLVEVSEDSNPSLSVCFD